MYRVIIDFIANRATPCPGAFLALLYFNDHSSVPRVYYFVTQIRLHTSKLENNNKRIRVLTENKIITLYTFMGF